MRRYNSFFVQTWVDVLAEDEVCRYKIEHVQTGEVVVVEDVQHLSRWLREHMAAPVTAAAGREPRA